MAFALSLSRHKLYVIPSNRNGKCNPFIFLFQVSNSNKNDIVGPNSMKGLWNDIDLSKENGLEKRE